MDGHSVFVIGDSISMHYGPWLENYLTPSVVYSRKHGSVSDTLNLDLPTGANGGDSSMVLRYLRSHESHGEIGSPTLLLVNCGLHDIKRDLETGSIQVDAQTYADNLHSIVETGQKLCKTLCWIRTTPVDEKIHNRPQSTFHRFGRDCDEYNTIADAIMNAAGVPSVDLTNFTDRLGDESGNSVYIDHVHFTEEIRRRQAAFIAGWITGYLAHA